MARAEAVRKRKANALNQGSNRPKEQQRTDDKVASPELAQHAGAAAPSDSWAVQQREYTTLILLCQAGRQAGRHAWFYYTSTKCAIPDDMAGQQRF